jgi:DNA polymerase-1
MIPGKHFNFVKNEFYEVTEFEGLKHFYKQCLMGDRSDNIKGIEKIGTKKADKILAECETEQHLFNAVRDAYSNDEEFKMNAQVLWIRQKGKEDWLDAYIKLCAE